MGRELEPNERARIVRGHDGRWERHGHASGGCVLVRRGESWKRGPRDAVVKAEIVSCHGTGPTPFGGRGRDARLGAIEGYDRIGVHGDLAVGPEWLPREKNAGFARAVARGQLWRSEGSGCRRAVVEGGLGGGDFGERPAVPEDAVAGKAGAGHGGGPGEVDVVDAVGGGGEGGRGVTTGLGGDCGDGGRGRDRRRRGCGWRGLGVGPAREGGGEEERERAVALEHGSGRRSRMSVRVSKGLF